MSGHCGQVFDNIRNLINEKHNLKAWAREQYFDQKSENLLAQCNEQNI